MKNSDPNVTLEWSSSSAVEPSGEPTDYVYETRGNLIDTGEDEDRAVVGRFGCYYLDLERARNDGMSASDVFDAHATTVIFYDAILDPQSEDYSSQIERLCGGPPLSSNVLILDRLEIFPKYRGKKLGLAVIRHMIQRFGAGTGLVALKPFPLQLEPRSTREEIDKWRSRLKLSEFKGSEKAATRKLVAYYAMVGFERLPGTAFMFRSNDLVLPDIAMD
jgi:hypothetical protein